MALNLAKIFGPEVDNGNSGWVPSSATFKAFDSDEIPPDTADDDWDDDWDYSDTFFPDGVESNAANEFHPTTLPPATVYTPPVCRCGSTRWSDMVLHHDPHNGQSTRRDCAKCRRFINFPRWHGLDK